MHYMKSIEHAMQPDQMPHVASAATRMKNRQVSGVSRLRTTGLALLLSRGTSDSPPSTETVMMH
jgi:hypothetical protein